VNYSLITDDLIFGPTPQEEDFLPLYTLGVGLIINPRMEYPPYLYPQDPPPLPTLWLPTLDSPHLPIPVSLLVKGVQVALPFIDGGRKAYIQCATGDYRAVAMGAAILIAQGFPVSAAIRLIQLRHPNVDTDAWYIREPILRFAEEWARLNPIQ
jgi:hypothetical protein